MSDSNEVIFASREVIEHKLLMALEDDDVVACVFTKDDLESLIAGLLRLAATNARLTNKQKGLLEGFRQLKKEAFGE